MKTFVVQFTDGEELRVPDVGTVDFSGGMVVFRDGSNNVLAVASPNEMLAAYEEDSATFATPYDDVDEEDED